MTEPRFPVNFRDEDLSFRVGFREDLTVFPTEMDTAYRGDMIPAYDGSYEVTPLAHTEQVLETTGKRMEGDVTVLEIPYYETSNESGGYTVNIG